MESCQSCRQPLQQDPSLNNLQQSHYQLISSSLPDQPLPPSLSNRVAHLNAPESSKQAYLQTTQRAPAESFIVLNQPLTSPPSLPPGEKPTKQTLLTLLLDLVSARTDTDHPLCTECARLLQDALTTQLEEVSFERDAFIGFERTVKEEGKGKKSREDIKELERVLAELTVEEDLATNALLALESDTASLQADLQALQAQSASLLTQELEFHGTHAALADEKQHLVALADSAQESYAADLKHLQRLEATNVWSDVFSIGVVKGEGGSRVGSINGLRLGKGGGATPVDWPEINAAWGLALFCLHSLARKAGFIFQTYRLVPLGSTSRIEELDSKSSFELYGSSDLALSRFLQNRRYENGMVAFLDCLRQFLEFARKRDSERDAVRRGVEKSWDFGRYHIVKEKIGEPSREVSIRSGYVPSSLPLLTAGSGDDSWTRACRYTLLTLHRLIGWTTRDGA